MRMDLRMIVRRSLKGKVLKVDYVEVVGVVLNICKMEGGKVRLRSVLSEVEKNMDIGVNWSKVYKMLDECGCIEVERVICGDVCVIKEYVVC